MTDTADDLGRGWIPRTAAVLAWSPDDVTLSDEGRMIVFDISIHERDIERLPPALQDLARVAAEHPKPHPVRAMDDLRKQNQELKIALSCMTASRDRWKAEAKGKITDEWRRRVAAGDVGEVE